MNAPATIPVDTIRTFLGPIPEAEHARRAKLESYRNVAMAMVASAKNETARTLAWQVIDWAADWVYRPGVPAEWLDQLNKLASRLLRTAIQAEEMDALMREASDA